MKELLDFIKQDTCPCCGNKLSFYMKALYSHLLKMNPCDEGFIFTPTFVNEKDSFVIISDSLLKVSDKIYNKNLYSTMFFFGICNENSIERKEESNDYEIIGEDICYYKSTKFLVLDKVADTISLKLSSDNDENISHAERFSFVSKTKDKHRVDVIDLDYNTNKTSFWHYSCSLKDLENEDYEPFFFNKEISAIKKITDFSDREKITRMFDSWIILS